MKIQHLHFEKNSLYGYAYFLLDNRLLLINYGTPKFNDYGEWNVLEILLSSELYNPDLDAVEKTPLKELEEVCSNIEIDTKELAFLEYLSKYLQDFDEEEANKSELFNISMIEVYEDSLLTMGFTQTDKINPTIVLPDGEYLNVMDWKTPDKFYEQYGIYKLIVPILSTIIKSFN